MNYPDNLHLIDSLLPEEVHETMRTRSKKRLPKGLSIMEPNPDKAKKVLEEALADHNWMDKDVHKTDLVVVIAKALGFLRGYKLPPETLEKYRCSFCGVSGVKLWRSIGSDRDAWCSKCGTEQAGLPDTIDDEGKILDRLSGKVGGRSDQIYSPKKGLNLLPYVPTPDGETWGYTSVPAEGCEWWKQLPTRK